MGSEQTPELHVVIVALPNHHGKTFHGWLDVGASFALALLGKKNPKNNPTPDTESFHLGFPVKLEDSYFMGVR